MSTLTCTDHLGNVYKSQRAMCLAHNVSQDVFGKRIQSGMSLEEALTRPVTKKPHVCREGAETTVRSGLHVTVVAWRSSDDIDVKFDDGTVVKTSMKNFAAKSIKHPLMSAKIIQNQCRIGEHSTTTRGETIEIVEYTNSADVTVKFSDGSTRHTDYKSFRRGNVVRESERTPAKSIHEHIGETSSNTSKKHPHTLTIIAANSADDITIQFEDGVVITGCKYHDFKTHRIAHPSDRVRYAAGEHSKDRNGVDIVLAQIVDKTHCIAQYHDGTQVLMLSKSFRAGFCAYPGFPKIGTNLSKCKVSDTLYIEHEISDEDSPHGQYFVCIENGEECIRTKSQLISAFITKFNL